MSARCNNCRFWDNEEIGLPADDPEIKEGWGSCLRTNGPLSEGSKALTFSFDSYTVQPLYTHNEFSCIQWQERESA